MQMVMIGLDGGREGRNLMQDTGYLIQDAGYLIQDAGCWILDT